MTNQEAIEFLKNIIDRESIGFVAPSGEGDVAIWQYHVEALQMAIKALELATNLQPTCNLASNCISRQAAIDALRDEFKRTPTTAIRAMGVISELPSAQPEIVRCKDCIKRELCRTSTTWAVAPKDDWFCGDAERRTDEHDDIIE